ncbi:hypothetical protein SBA3_2010011 [Candidatus Sulfopaludibacter sp. SbA3]|nr:hypothetical protein SBA3_2010011 [Candidatus Sulfopaludibacter sp. SbA3]
MGSTCDALRAGIQQARQDVFAGKVTEYTLKDVSIDDARFGVKAIGLDGTESLVVPCVYPARKKVEYETIQ